MKHWRRSAGNQLSGPIPAELRQLGALQHLDIVMNRMLSGKEALRLHLQEHNPECSCIC